MAKYIDADKLIAEIEGIRWFPQISSGYNDGREDMKMMVFDIIDSLQQEQPQVADASKMEPEVEGGCSEKPNDLLSEWTEEDERTRWNLCSLLTNLRVGKKIEESTFKKYYSWLKIIHIKPRKPRKSKQPEVDKQ